MGVHWSAEAYIAAKSFSGSFKRARAPRVGIKQKVPVCFAAYGIVFVFNFAHGSYSARQAHKSGATLAQLCAALIPASRIGTG